MFQYKNTYPGMYQYGVGIMAYTTQFDTMQRKVAQRCIRYTTKSLLVSDNAGTQGWPQIKISKLKFIFRMTVNLFE